VSQGTLRVTLESSEAGVRQLFQGEKKPANELLRARVKRPELAFEGLPESLAGRPW